MGSVLAKQRRKDSGNESENESENEPCLNELKEAAPTMRNQKVVLLTLLSILWRITRIIPYSGFISWNRHLLKYEENVITTKNQAGKMEDYFFSSVKKCLELIPAYYFKKSKSIKLSHYPDVMLLGEFTISLRIDLLKSSIGTKTVFDSTIRIGKEIIAGKKLSIDSFWDTWIQWRSASCFQARFWSFVCTKEPGEHFQDHRDTTHTENHHGTTLLVDVYREHEGGDLVPCLQRWASLEPVEPIRPQRDSLLHGCGSPTSGARDFRTLSCRAAVRHPGNGMFLGHLLLCYWCSGLERWSRWPRSLKRRTRRTVTMASMLMLVRTTLINYTATLY